MTIQGIDVSNYNSATYSLTGFDFIVVKATQSTNYINPKHDAQVARARSNGRVVGHYHFFVTGNVQAQAEYFVQHAAPQAGEFLACDWESNPANGTNPTNAEKDAFIKAVKKLKPGLKVGLYTGQSQWKDRDTTNYYGDFLWIARYGATTPGVSTPVTIWQYTSTPQDTNIGYFDSRETMAAWAAGETGADVAITDAEWTKFESVLKSVVPTAVLTTDNIIANPDPNTADTNPFITLSTSVKNIESVVRRAEVADKATAAVITTLVQTVTALAANTAELDPAELIATIKAELAKVTITLNPGS
jgi:hypothetical protein